MEAGGGGGGLEVGHIFARLDAKLDDSKFKQFDKAIDQSRAKADTLGKKQDELAGSNDKLTVAQQRQVKSLRDQGSGWGDVSKKLNLSGSALRSYSNDLGKVDSKLKSHNKTVGETTREQDKASKSTRSWGRDTDELGGVLGSLGKVLGGLDSRLKAHDEQTKKNSKDTDGFGRSTRSASKDVAGFDGSISRVNRVTTFFSKTLSLVKWPAFITGAGAALQGANALTAGVTALASALVPLSGLLVEIPAVMGAAGQALGTGFLALMGVAEGVKALNSAELKSGKDSEASAKKQRTSAASIVSAQEGVRSAHEGVRTANESLGQAERAEEQSVRQLNAARREAVQSLVDQRNAAIDARLAEKGSQLGLRRAVSELYKAESNPKSSFLELEELELRVREAKQGVKEARLESARATNEDEKAHERGVAKAPAVTEANRQVAESHRGVASAKRDVGKSHREVTKAERGSTEAVAGGNEALGETNTALQKIHETFAELGPDQAKFARFLFGLKPELKGLQDVAAKGFLPGAEKGITSAIKNLPVVKRVIGDTSNVMGKLAERAGKTFGSKGFGHDLEKVGRGNAQTLGLMARAGEHVFKALDNVLVVAQPLVKWIGEFTNHTAAGLEKATKAGRKDGGLAGFFTETEETAKTLINTAKNLGGFLGVAFAEAKPLGKEILSVFETSSKGLDEWAHSATGKNSIGEYFKDAKAPLWEAGRLVRDITDDFFEMGSGEGMKSITNLLHTLRVELLPVFKDVTEETTSSFGPHLIEMVSQVLQLFGKLTGGSGPLTLYVEALTGAAKFTNFLLDDIPGMKGVVTNLLGVVAVMKTIEGLGKFTGITKGLELAFGKDFGGKLKGKLKSQIGGAIKSAFAATSNEAKYALAWGQVVAGEAAAGIGKQLGKFKAVARKAVIAFIGTFAPELAAEMAASGSIGQVLSARFPKMAALFKGGGKLAGKAFLVGVILGAALIGVELGNMINKKFPDLGPSIRHWGIRAGESFVNGLIDAVNLGIKGINTVLNKANILGKLGVSAPQIDEVGNVNWHSSGERKKEAGKELSDKTGRATIEGPGGKLIPTQSQAEIEGNRHRGGKKPEDEAADTRKKVVGEHKHLRKEVEDETDKLEKGVVQSYAKTRKGAGDETSLLDKAVSANFAGARSSSEKANDGIFASTSTRFEEARKVAAARTTAQRETVEGNVKQMSHATAEGMDQIQKRTEHALSVFGIKDTKLELRGGAPSKELDGPPAPVQHKAEGGSFMVPGTGLQDNVYMPELNAMVAPGEEIFAANRHQQPLLDYAVDAVYGTPNLDSFFSTYNTPHWAARGGGLPRPRRYAGGGRIVIGPEAQGDTTQGVEPTIMGDLKKLSAELGKVVYVINGYRTPQHSVEVGGFADDPHTRGEAADIGIGSELRDSLFSVPEAALKAVGLYRPFYPPDPKEVNHVQLLAGGSTGSYAGNSPSGAKIGATASHIKSPSVVGAGKSTFGALAQTSLDRMTSAANKYIGKKSAKRRGGLGGLNISVPSGPIEKMAREMVGQVWGPGEFNAFAGVEEAEAGWNPRAENPSSGAAGLAQALPASKYPAGAWPYTGPQSAKLQLEWMIQYIKGRYGTPAGALAHENSYNWYARGGRMGGRQKLAKGGAFKGNLNKTFPGAVFGPETSKWESLYQMPPYVGAALAEAAGKYAGTGMPGWTMEQVSLGEGDLKPGSRSTDDGWGWLAITKPFGDSFGVPQMGGYDAMLNPVKNAYVAARMWGGSSSHFGSGGTWHGSSHVTDENKHYTGAYDVRNALGGLSFAEAITGRRGKESIGGSGSKAVPELKNALGRGVPLGPKKKPKRYEKGLSENQYASKPSGKKGGGPGGPYSPKALARTVAETGIPLPYGLSKWGNVNGAPNWQGMSVQAYNKLVMGYYAKVAEYRSRLGEERKQAEESTFGGKEYFPTTSPTTALTALSASTTSAALGYHSPIAGEVGAYGAGSATLAGMDASMGATRSAYEGTTGTNRASYLNTYNESYLAPYRHKEGVIEYNKENQIALDTGETESKEFARAKLAGLRKKLIAQRTPGKAVKPKRKHRGTPNPNKKKKAKRAARGGRLRGAARSSARRLSKGGRAIGLGASHPVGVKPSVVAKHTAKKVNKEIARHTAKVAKRAARKNAAAEERAELELEGVLDPVEEQRLAIEEKQEHEREAAEEREAYELGRREQLAPLLNELAANVQRTALVGASQSSLFGPPTFAKGGKMPRPAAVAPGGSGSAPGSHVHVPVALNLSGDLGALNPHIEAVVDDKINRLGVNAGTARATVSAPGRRVSYGGK